MLRARDVPATFFVVGARAAARPDLIRRMHDEGHEVGVHTFTHVNAANVTPRRLRLELDQSQLAIAGATGHTTSLLRLPYSSGVDGIGSSDWAAIRASGNYRVVYADLDTHDWSQPGVDAIIRAGLPTDGRGAIVMLHDGGGDRAQTVAALDGLITELMSRGYVFDTVTGAVGLSSPWHAASGVQRLQGEVVSVAVRAAGWLTEAIKVAFLVLAALAVVRTVLLLALARRHARLGPPGPSARRWRLPPVSVIVPAYNEEVGIAATVRSLIASDYPDLEVIVVDDGSTDATAAWCGPRAGGRTPDPAGQRGQAGGAQHRDRRRAARPPRPGRRRHGLRARRRPSAGRTVRRPGRRRRVRQHQGRQPARAARPLAAHRVRHRVQPGPAHVRRAAVHADRARRHRRVPARRARRCGRVGRDTLAEDTDLTMAVIRAGWRVVYAPEARAWTEAPATLRQLWRQRYRWCYGTMQAMWKHRGSVVESGPGGRLGRRGLPYLLAFQVVLPLLAPAVDVATIYRSSPHRPSPCCGSGWRSWVCSWSPPRTRSGWTGTARAVVEPAPAAVRLPAADVPGGDPVTRQCPLRATAALAGDPADREMDAVAVMAGLRGHCTGFMSACAHPTEATTPGDDRAGPTRTKQFPVS